MLLSSHKHVKSSNSYRDVPSLRKHPYLNENIKWKPLLFYFNKKIHLYLRFVQYKPKIADIINSVFFL